MGLLREAVEKQKQFYIAHLVQLGLLKESDLVVKKYTFSQIEELYKKVKNDEKTRK